MNPPFILLIRTSSTHFHRTTSLCILNNYVATNKVIIKNIVMWLLGRSWWLFQRIRISFLLSAIIFLTSRIKSTRTLIITLIYKSVSTISLLIACYKSQDERDKDSSVWHRKKLFRVHIHWLIKYSK